MLTCYWTALAPTEPLDWDLLQNTPRWAVIASSDIKAWVQVAPWLHDLEERCVEQGINFRVWRAPRGSIQDKIQTRAWG